MYGEVCRLCMLEMLMICLNLCLYILGSVVWISRNGVLSMSCRMNEKCFGVKFLIGFMCWMLVLLMRMLIFRFVLVSVVLLVRLMC